MADLQLEEFLLTYFPKNKKIVVFSYGNIYQQETNFKIALNYYLSVFLDNTQFNPKP